jgi:hypothetical protein
MHMREGQPSPEPGETRETIEDDGEIGPSAFLAWEDLIDAL